AAIRERPRSIRISRRGSSADVRNRLLLRRREARALHDDEIARQTVEYALGRAAEEDALETAARDGAHDDEVDARVLGHFGDRCMRRTLLEVHVDVLTDAAVREQLVERVAVSRFQLRNELGRRQ